MAHRHIVIGYGTKGRSVVTTLVQSGTAPESIVIVDRAPRPPATPTRPGWWP